MRSILVSLLVVALAPIATSSAQQTKRRVETRPPAEETPTFSMDGSTPVSAPEGMASTTLSELVSAIQANPELELDARFHMIENVEVEDCRFIKRPASEGESVYFLQIYEPASGERTLTTAFHKRIIFGTAVDSIGQKVLARRDLRRKRARIRFAIGPFPLNDHTVPWLATVSSIEWLDESGQIIETAY